MTQMEVCDLIGVDQSRFSRWESDLVTPSEDNVRRLEELLQVRDESIQRARASLQVKLLADKIRFIKERWNV